MRRWLNRYSRGGFGRNSRGDADWATAQLEDRGIHDPDVLRAMRVVPRERFVPVDLVGSAYGDGALPIGHGQTISQPYIVASMTQTLALTEWSVAHNDGRPRVLDVGT